MTAGMATPTGTASAPRSRISRRGLLATGALTAGALAAACAPGQSGGDSGSAPQASGRVVELRSHARAASEIDGYQKNIDAFNKQYEGKYKATYEPITGDRYWGRRR